MSILDKFLKKIGVKSFNDLTQEEKETFSQWEVALSGRKLTDEDVKNFLLSEREIAIDRLTDVDLKTQDAIFRKVEVRFIKKILTFLEMPTVEKTLLEKQIENRT